MLACLIYVITGKCFSTPAVFVYLDVVNSVLCSTVMEAFAVASPAAQSVKRTRQSFSDDQIGKAVALARQIGSMAASKKLNSGVPPADQMQEATIRKWLSRWKTEGNFWEAVRNKRGRPNVLSAVPGGVEEWARQVDSLRAQGASVTGRVSAVIARAVAEEKAPSLLEVHGGALKMSIEAGSKLLQRAGKSFRKRTSTRIIPPDDVVAEARDSFYKNISDCFTDGPPDEGLVINFDQTFQLYNPNRGYTWEKKAASRVQLTDSREGFTFLPVVSMLGVLGAQLIFGGSTAAVLPSISAGPLLRFECTPSHWSDENTTISLWNNIILPYIARRRAVLGDPYSPALVLADAFRAHWTPRVRAVVASADSIFYIAIPDSLTHLFQPLDLGIIAAMKHSIQRRKDDFLEKEVATAIRENRGVVLSKSRPVLRNNIAMWIKEVVADPVICSEHCCKTGFSRAGVARVLYGEDAVPPDVDDVIQPPVCADCGEFGKLCTELPDCEHFVDVIEAILCDSCLHNHASLCDVV